MGTCHTSAWGRHAACGFSHLTRTARIKVGVGQPDYASGCLPGCQHLQYDMVPPGVLHGMAGQIWGGKGEPDGEGHGGGTLADMGFRYGAWGEQGGQTLPHGIGMGTGNA